jgi:4-hydroxybenzoate polyprenyltransferase
LFLSLKFLEYHSWVKTISAGIVFMLVSWVVYIANDIINFAEDSLCTYKKKRAIAGGDITIPKASLIAFVLMGIAIFLSFYLLSQKEQGIILIYIAIQILYNFYCRKEVLLDIVCIASGFVIRLILGSVAIDAIISPWAISSTFFLALFLASCKRYSEVKLGQNFKGAIAKYNLNFIQALILISCSITILSYSIYCVNISLLKNQIYMIYTVLPVLLCLLKYLYHTYLTEDAGVKTMSIILKDKTILFSSVIWFVSIILIFTL